jgi:mycothiol synthase
MAHDEHPPSPTPAAQRWESPWSPQLDEQLAAEGYDRVRLLHQMRRALPLPEELRATGPSIRVRAWREDDAEQFLEVNNRAFSWHPEQGGWDRDRLASELDRDWFDPSGFLVHEGDDGRIDGFCWTKVHPRLDDGDPEGPRPPAGEIYVIAADPATHGTGLGRALTVAGLDHLAGAGLELGMLYVEADNEPAVRLYRRLGFEVHHSDAGYAPRAHR